MTTRNRVRSFPVGPAVRGTITGEVDVSVITLDDYCSELGIARVDLLKIDTQGYDLEVLKGPRAYSAPAELASSTPR